MFLIVLGAVLVAALVGLAVKQWLEFKKSSSKITWREFYLGMAVSPVIAVIMAWAGWSMARSGQLTFYEYLNGWEVSAIKEYTQCSRDGPCRWEFDCDPYIVMVAYECMCSTNKDGITSCSTCYRPETRYHSCPYVNREYHFYVDTTLGRYTIATNVFPANPQSDRWDNRSKPIPKDLISRVGTGDPPFWVQVKQRCESGQPGPVTTRREYTNYILASEHTLMREHSGDIQELKSANLLPDLSNTVKAFYHADKVYSVGFNLPDVQSWQMALEYFNADLGSQRQGDLHLVIVNSNLVKNPDRYAMALKAHWQDKNNFGDKALSKNAIVVILGTIDGKTVSWSRAFTGMPLGNEKMIVEMRDGLRGLPLEAESLVGPKGSRRMNPTTVNYPPGGNFSPLKQIVFGLGDYSGGFKRISMSGDDGQGGFLYLKNEIQPTRGQTWIIFILTAIVCCGAWIWAANHYDPSEGRYRWR